jgi:Lon protease-like protein
VDTFDSLDDPNPLDSFDGMTRLFPLPNVVLFPGVMLPLHIFEPRYREMVADAMDSDRLITMVLLKPGYEDEYEGSPPICEIGCLGQIIHHEFQDDGKSNLILRGVSRVRIDAEEPSDRLYRVARVSLLDDEYPPAGPDAVSGAVRGVLDSMVEILTLVGRSGDAKKIAAANEVPAGRICDLACHCLGFDVSVKQSLLAERSVARRADTLQAWMQALLKTIQRRVDPSGHPPEFSQN